MEGAARTPGTRWCSRPSAAAGAGVRSAADRRRDLRAARGRAGEPIAFYRELEQAPEFQRAGGVGRHRARAVRRAGARRRPRARDAAVPRQRRAAGEGRASSGRSGGRSARSATACSCSRAAGVLGASAARRACRSPWSAARYLLTAWRLGRYYRTYPAYVEDEVVAALDDPHAVRRGRRRCADRDDTGAFVVEDGRYVSARWPGDAYLFAQRFEALLSAGPRPQPAAATPRQAT